MKHREHASKKNMIYKNAGYDCKKPVYGEKESYFYSIKDNIYRKHIFTNSSVRIETVDASVLNPIIEEQVIETPIEVIEEPIVEVVPEIVESVQQEEKPKKKTTRRKKGV